MTDITILATKLVAALEIQDAANALVRNLREQITAALAGEDEQAIVAETALLTTIERLRLVDPGEEEDE